MTQVQLRDSCALVELFAGLRTAALACLLGRIAVYGHLTAEKDEFANLVHAKHFTEHQPPGLCSARRPCPGPH